MLALAIFGVVQAVTGGDEDTPTSPSGPTDADNGPATGDDAEQSDGTTSTADAATTGEAADPTCADTHEVRVLAAPDIAPAITQVAQDADPCTTYDIVAQSPLEVVTSFAGGQGPEAQVWIPNSPAFADAAKEAGVPVEQGPIVAT